MRIHTDTLTHSELVAALPGGVYAYITAKGSRKRDHAFEVTLYVFEKDALHRRYGNSGGYGRSDDVAATWDEWGVWIAKLYKSDHDALIGPYESYSSFFDSTMKHRDYVQSWNKPTSLAWRTHLAPWLD